MPKISVIPWIVKKLKGAIGIVEDTDTAVHAIASGKYVVWKGTLCKTTAAISIGDTLSAGTGGNLAAVEDGGLNDVSGNIPEVVNALNSDSTTSALSAAQGKALNSKITLVPSASTYTTLDSIKSFLEGISATLADNEYKEVRINTGAPTNISPFEGYGYYTGTLTRYNSTTFVCDLVSLTGSTVTINKAGSSWNIDSLSFKFPFTRLSQVAFTGVDIQNRVLMELSSTETANRKYRLEWMPSDIKISMQNNGGSWETIYSVDSKLSTTSPTVTKTANIKTNSVVSAKRNANVVSIYMDVYAVSTSSDYVSIASLSETPSTNVYFVMVDVNDNAKMCRLTSGGALQIHGTVADRNYMGSLTYIVNS